MDWRSLLTKAHLKAKPLTQIRIVSFDVGGTLIVPWPSVGHIYAEVAAQNGYPDLDPVTLTRRFNAAWHDKQPFTYRQADWADLVDQTFASLVEPPPSRTFFPALYRRFTESSAYRVYPDAVSVLSHLRRRRFQLAIISNWDERLRSLLDALGLTHFFDRILISCEIGFAKPAPEIFQRALTELNAPPEAVLHVGDTVETDVLGAESAHLNALWLNRHGAQPPRSPCPSIHSLAALDALLA